MHLNKRTTKNCWRLLFIIQLFINISKSHANYQVLEFELSKEDTGTSGTITSLMTIFISPCTGDTMDFCFYSRNAACQSHELGTWTEIMSP